MPPAWQVGVGALAAVMAAGGTSHHADANAQPVPAAKVRVHHDHQSPTAEPARAKANPAKANPANSKQVVAAHPGPGIDLTWRTDDRGRAAYHLTLAPGAHVDQAVLGVAGRTVKVTPSGELEITTPTGKLVQHKPVAWQLIDGKRRSITVSYRLLPGNRIGFTLGTHNPKLPVMIDPSGD